MAAREGQATEARDAERRRSLVRKLRFRDQLSYGAIVERLAKLGIATTKTTVCRDVRVIRREFGSFAKDFDVLAEIGIRAELLRVIASRALRASGRTRDDGGMARLLKVAVLASNSEIALLQAVGLIPNDLGTLRVQERVEHIPNGEDMQRIWGEVNVRDDDLKTPAEIAWMDGDAAAALAAAKEAE